MTPLLDAKPEGGPAVRLPKTRSALHQATLAASVCVAVVYISSVAFNRIWCFELMSHFRVQWAALMIPLAVALLATRRRYWGWAFALLTASAIWSSVASGIPVSQPRSGTTRLRIMSANVLTANPHSADFERLVETVNPDILAIMEYTQDWDSKLTNIQAKFPYAVTRPRTSGFGIALYSKRPLHNVEATSLLKYFDGPTIFCDVDIDGQSLSIVAIHTISPISSLRFEARNEQLRILARRIGDDPRPRIVVGDFNATTWSPYLQDFLRTGQLRDSRQGFGLQPTWPQFFWPMFIPIDQAFVSQHIHVHRRWVEGDIGSDHYPIVVEISIEPRKD